MSSGPAIPQFRAAAYVHNVSGDKSRFVGKQINAGIRDGVTLRTIAERMDFRKAAFGETPGRGVRQNSSFTLVLPRRGVGYKPGASFALPPVGSAERSRPGRGAGKWLILSIARLLDTNIAETPDKDPSGRILSHTQLAAVRRDRLAISFGEGY